MKAGLRLRRSHFAGMAVALAVVLSGCQLGPGRLKVASSHYSDAVRIAQAEQLLGNLVRLRYRDGPLFLSVTSISTQFEFNSAIGVDGTSSWSPGNNVVGADAGVGYSEKPTISFSIMGGEKFQKKILTPLRVGAISLLAESGWRSDRVLQLTVENLNGLRNAPKASGPTPDQEPQFRQFTEATRLLAKLARDGVLDFEYQTRREALSAPLASSQVDGDHTVNAIKAGTVFVSRSDGRVQLMAEKRRLVMRFAPRSAGSEEVARLRELLSLDPTRSHFEVVDLQESDFDPLQPEKRMTQLAIDSRSLMGVLYYLSHGVEVSDADVESGIVTQTTDASGNPFDWTELIGGLFSVHQSESWRRPADAAFAVRHRGRWFYIADSDLTSKSTFLLLGQLFSLQAGDVDEVTPVLTLPVGG